MIFNVFFNEYKLRVLSISQYIKFKDMAKYKLIGLAMSSIFVAISIVLLFISNNAWIIFYILSAISMGGTILIANRKSERESMLENHYKPYAKERMKAFSELLAKYGIDYKDEKKMTLLIEQANRAKDESDLFKSIRTPIVATCTYIIIPILLSISNKVIDGIEMNQLLYQSIQWGMLILILLGIWIAISTFVKSVFGGQTEKYGDLKYDLEQMMIFGDQISKDV